MQKKTAVLIYKTIISGHVKVSIYALDWKMTVRIAWHVGYGKCPTHYTLTQTTQTHIHINYMYEVIFAATATATAVTAT